jgi:AraC-like DNA-binding protein/mannose-6-phosphate isomerase-like protein (cupin superfamily)
MEQKYYLAAFSSNKTELLKCGNGMHLFQIADVHCKPEGRGGALHEQWCDEITFVYKGVGECIHNGLTVPVKSGQIHLCSKGMIHKVRPEKNSLMHFFCIGFTLDDDNPLSTLLKKACDEIKRTNNPILSDCTDLMVAFETALNALYVKERDEVSDAVLLNSLNYIIASVCNRFLLKHESTADISEQDALLFHLISYLKKNVYKIDALHNIGNDTGYSYSHLSHLFTQKMGQSLHDFFTSLRMDTATELLRRKKVTEVAEIMGYSSSHTFSRAYKQFYNETPKSVREMLLQSDLLKYVK